MLESPDGAGTARAAGEARLADQAAAGDAAAFAALYDRYELLVFNVCLRVLGTSTAAGVATQAAFMDALQRWSDPPPGELELGVDLLAAAHAALDGAADHDAAAANGRPGGEATETADPELARSIDPERAELLASLQDDVRRANEQLTEPQREVLALRDLDGFSYEQIASVTGSSDDSMIELIALGRIGLRDALRESSLAQEVTAAPDCQRALTLLAMRLDGQLNGHPERDWLSDHLGDCATCQASLDAMQEARVAYRAWLPLLPPPWLRVDTLAEAAARSDDGSDLEDPVWTPSAGNGAPLAARKIGAAVATPFADAGAIQGDPLLAAGLARLGDRGRVRRPVQVAVLAPIVLLAGAAAAVLAMSGGGGTDKRTAKTPSPKSAAAPASATPSPQRAAVKRKRRPPAAAAAPTLPPRTTPTQPTQITPPRTMPPRTPRSNPVSRAPRRTPQRQPQVIGGGRENRTPAQPAPSRPTPTPTGSTPTTSTPTVGSSTGN